MNDDFLHQFRQPPRKAFATELYHRLSLQDQTRNKPAGGIPAIRWFGIGFAALCLAFAMILAISPSARAKLVEVIKSIGGLTYIETDEYPGEGPEETFPEDTMSLPEAKALLPFTFELPTWAPESFALDQEQVTVMVSDQFDLSYIRLHWQNQDNITSIDMLVEYHKGLSATGDYIASPDSIEEVDVNGIPAGLVRGAWNVDTQQWGLTELMHLRWERGSVVYNLTAMESEVSAEELIRMAESIP